MGTPLRSFRIAILPAAALILAALSYAQQKRPLTHKDYDSWRSISGQTLSRDGKYLAYSWMPQEGDGEIVIVELATGKEWRHGAGALPPPPATPQSEINPDAPPPARSVRILMTGDSKYLVATTFPAKAETEQARKEKRKPEEVPKTGALIVRLGGADAIRLQDVKTVQVPEKGGAWLAYSRNPRQAESAKPAESANPQDQDGDIGEPDQRRAAAAKPGAAGSGDRPEYGTDLILRDLTKPDGAERVFPNALDFNFTRDGKVLWFTVSSRKPEENGFFQLEPGSNSAPAALLAGKGKYLKPAWNRQETQLAFFSDRDDADSKTPRFKVYLWERGAEKARELISSATPGFPAGMVVSDKGALGFSRDGSKLFVPAAPPPKPPKDSASDAPADEKVLLDLWHWQDDAVQPMQKVRANAERNRTYRGVYHLAEGRYVQIASPEMQNFTASDDGRIAFGTDDRAYRRRVDYEGGTRSDIYQVDTATGAKKLVLEGMRGGFMSGGVSFSPDGRYGLFWKDRHWRVLDTSTGAVRNLTEALPYPVYNPGNDQPDEPPSFGNAGWTRDSQSVLVYDEFDVWQVFAGGRAPRNITEGAGRKANIQFRVQRIDLTGGEDDEDRYLDPSKPLYLRAEHRETYATGFYRDRIDGAAPPVQLLWGDKEYRFAGRAKDAGVALVSASRFDEFPDLHVTDLDFRLPRKVTNGGRQMESFLWGTAELIRFRNLDGTPLKAALFKPANFDPSKKYPLLVYIYEKLSQTLHGFVPPSPGTSINTSYYVSNGYLVLRPDIVYTVGNPGQSALKCVLPAIQEVVDRGYVDENAIGIQGHSWGGYQIAYMVTQTNRFKAAEAGAPVGNMTSAYSGIRWGTGMPRQFQYERTQSRIGQTLFEAPHKYLENSPVFHAARVKTPLLILHNDQDDAVPWYQGIELFLALRRNGKEAYLFNYNGEYHGLRRRHNQKDWTVRMQQFFDHHLKGAPKPEWMVKGVPFLDREEEKERFQQALSDR